MTTSGNLLMPIKANYLHYNDISNSNYDVIFINDIVFQSEFTISFIKNYKRSITFLCSQKYSTCAYFPTSTCATNMEKFPSESFDVYPWL